MITSKKTVALFSALGIAVGGYFVATDTKPTQSKILKDALETNYTVVVMDENGSLYEAGEEIGLMRCSTKAYFSYNEIVIANANINSTFYNVNLVGTDTWEELENDNSAPYFCCGEYPKCNVQLQYSKEYKYAVENWYKGLE